jgi:hypothetical protein
LIPVRDHKAVAVRGAAITLAAITLAVIKTFLIKWPTRWMIMPMIQATGVPFFVRVKPQC